MNSRLKLAIDFIVHKICRNKVSTVHTEDSFEAQEMRGIIIPKEYSPVPWCSLGADIGDMLEGCWSFQMRKETISNNGCLNNCHLHKENIKAGRVPELE